MKHTAKPLPLMVNIEPTSFMYQTMEIASPDIVKYSRNWRVALEMEEEFYSIGFIKLPDWDII